MGTTKTPSVWVAADRLANVVRTIVTEGSAGMMGQLQGALENYDQAMAAHKAQLEASTKQMSRGIKVDRL